MTGLCGNFPRRPPVSNRGLRLHVAFSLYTDAAFIGIMLCVFIKIHVLPHQLPSVFLAQLNKYRSVQELRCSSKLFRYF